MKAIKKCANCGNKDPMYLSDENDTVYCMKCYHRTRKTDGKDDAVECPYCHRLRDRKAFTCRVCNAQGWDKSNKKEFEWINEFLNRKGL